MESEQITALALARRVLDQAGADPDDDLRVLARQLIRKTEQIERLENRIKEMQDSNQEGR